MPIDNIDTKDCQKWLKIDQKGPSPMVENFHKI